MPYLGGLTWSDVLATLNSLPLDHRSGRDIVSALDADEAGSPVNASRSGAARGFLARSAYTQAVCWIAACLADALQHAHDRGLVHLDIKPSNILLAGDGQPMLLDFHLAREILPAGSQPPSRLGGTRGYMSPEQQLAAEAVRDGRPLSMDLDGRSDVYSLGATLYESLTGRLPPGDEAASRRYWRRSATSASRGLEDIVHKCLAQNRPIATPMPRVAADLRRHLADLPLAGVPNRSVRERWQKWRRRKPYALAGAAAVLAVLTVALGTLTFLRSDRMNVAQAGSSGQRKASIPAIFRLPSSNLNAAGIPSAGCRARVT